MDLNETEIKNSQPTVTNEDRPTIPINNSENDTNSLNPIDDDESFYKRGTSPFISRGPLSPTSRGNDPDFQFPVIPEVAESIPDVNVYQHKKTLAQGMMDLALFSANANQLRYVLDSNTDRFYKSGIGLITVSLLLQVAIGVGLIWNSRYNVKDKKEICIANKINNFTIIGIFLVTIINVFICGFGVTSAPVVVSAPTTVLLPTN